MSSGDEETFDDFNLEEEENRIKRIIGKIEKNRNRACYQNILTFAKREKQSFQMDTLKEVIKGMADKNIIYNKGKDEMDKESFKMFRTDENHVDLSTQTQIQNGDEDLDDCFESYINDKFIETLKCLIKSEVNSAFSEHEENGNNVNECNKMEMVHNCNNEALVKSLNEHISFLQNELQSRHHH